MFLFWKQIAGAMGASGVALGAIGAHALKETLTKNQSLAAWQTATTYQIFHATALLSLAAAADAAKSLSSSDSPYKSSSSNNSNNASLQRAGMLWSIGSLFFSGSIYCLSLKVGPRAILGPMTPVGGLLLIGGWIAAGWG